MQLSVSPPLLATKQMHRALAIDLGSHCGYAWANYDAARFPHPLEVFAGQFDLQMHDWDTSAMRLVRMRQFLNVVLPDVIFFEEIKNTPVAAGKMSVTSLLARVWSAADLLGAFKAALAIWAEENQIPLHPYPIGTIKRFATGAGNASKEAMIVACNERYGTTYDPATYNTSHIDNEVDAVFILELGMTEYAEGLPTRSNA